jgi:hypothetical protein
MMSAIERFNKYVIKNEEACWDWKGCKLKGYGIVQVDGRSQRAHRVSYEIHKGPIPHGMNVLHQCDNPDCSNPDHLFLGTHQDNVADRVKKRRNANMNGENGPGAKLTFEQVSQIKHLLLGTKWGTQKQIALQFGIHESTLCDIKHGRTWGDL